MALSRRRTIIVSAVALLSGIGVAAAVSVVSDDDGSVPVDAVLDEPGVYQDPGIGTNAPLAGKPLADAPLTELDGTRTTLQAVLAAANGRPLVVNVWFSTCQPCKRELPHFAAVSADLGDEVAFLGINPNDTADTARSFAAQFGVTYPTYLDPDGAVLTANGIATFPSTLFVRADGTVARLKAGEISEDELRRTIDEELLG